MAAIRHLLTADVSGPVNLVAPNPVTNREFTKALGKACTGRRCPSGFLASPSASALGGFADEALLVGQRLAPKALEASGFAFQDTELGSALQDLLART